MRQGERRLTTEKHTRFTSNGIDMIYHQATANSLRFAFLVVSEFFDTPNEGVTKTLQFICDKLNEEEGKSGDD
jgi:hypothetical protein